MWVAISTAAAVCQVSRNMSAKRLSNNVSPAMNTWARFTFSLPFSLAAVCGISLWLGLPKLPASAYLWCFGGALVHIVANVFLVSAYRHSTFCEASVFTRLEGVFGAVLGVMFFGENPTCQAWVGLCLSFAGVALMNIVREQTTVNPRETAFINRGQPSGLISAVMRLLVFNRGSLFAMLTGFCWALACYVIKHACHDMCFANPDARYCTMTSASYILLHLTWMEVAILTVYLVCCGSGEFKQLGPYWRVMLNMGFLSFAASVLWIWAYNFTLVAYVRAFGNVESLLSAAISHRVLKEQGVLRQLPGIAAIVAGVALVIVGS